MFFFIIIIIIEETKLNDLDSSDLRFSNNIKLQLFIYICMEVAR